MSLKELEKLNNESEELREELILKTQYIKELNANIRMTEKSIKETNSRIANIELNDYKYREDNASDCNETDTNTELANLIFEVEINRKLFSSIAQSVQFRRGNRADIPIDVEFERVVVTFYVSHNDTFENLRYQTASYWALPESEIFFSDQPAASGMQEIFLISMNVSKELYVWKNVKLKNKNFCIYLILGNYEKIDERLNKIFTKDLFDETNINIEDQISEQSNDKTRRKYKIGKKKEKNRPEKIKQRKFWHRLQYILQWLLYIALFLIWVYTLSKNFDVEKSAWVNHCISKALIWGFKYSDTNTRTVFGPAVESDFLSVTNTEKLWEYILNIQTVLTSDSEEGLLANNIYTLQYMEVRQLRTEISQCYKYLNYTCTEPYSMLRNSYEEKLGPNYYQEYKTKSKNVFISGEFALYTNNGYTNNVNLLDENEFVTNLTELKNSGWIDEGTRAVFVTINFWNPDSDILALAMPFFEINPSGFFTQNFKLYSIKQHLFNGSQIVANLFILIICFVLLCMEIRQNIRHPDEIKAFIYGTCLKSDDVLYEEIKSYSSDNIFIRLKKPTKVEFFSFFTIACVLLLEIISLSFYLGLYKQAVEVSIGYTDLFGALQGVSMLNDANTLVTLLMALNIFRLLAVWLSVISEYFQVILKFATSFLYYINCVLFPVLTFSIFFHFFLGHADENFTTIGRSFISIIKLFCGRWPGTTTFIYFIDVNYLILIFIVLIIWKNLVICLQISRFFEQLRKIEFINK